MVAPPTAAEATVDQRDLVERARRGDHDAFAALAGAAIARLDAAARLILRDRELARDAVQDAMMRAWRDLPGLRDPEKFDAWLHRLTVHACIDAARHRRRRPIEVELNVLDSPTVADISSQIIDRDLLDRGLRALEPEWRAVVVLHYYLGMPLPDVAESLGFHWAPRSRGFTVPWACFAARSASVPRPSPPWSRKDGWHDPDRSIRARSADRPGGPGRRAHTRLLHRHPRADRPFTAAACLGDPRKVVPKHACHQQPADLRPRGGPGRGDPRRGPHLQPYGPERRQSVELTQPHAERDPVPKPATACQATSSAGGWRPYATSPSLRVRCRPSSSGR